MQDFLNCTELLPFDLIKPGVVDELRTQGFVVGHNLNRQNNFEISAK